MMVHHLYHLDVPAFFSLSLLSPFACAHMHFWSIGDHGARARAQRFGRCQAKIQPIFVIRFTLAKSSSVMCILAVPAVSRRRQTFFITLLSGVVVWYFVFSFNCIK